MKKLTSRQQALKWWNDHNDNWKTEMTNKEFGFGKRYFLSLTGREIEVIWEKEVGLLNKWLNLSDEDKEVILLNKKPDDIKKEINDILLNFQNNKIDVGDASNELLALLDVSRYYSKHEVDLVYLTGVFNVSGIDGLQKEIKRLKELNKNPHDIIIAARKQ